MSIAAKAAWPLLWTVADDRGVFDWKPKGIKAAILPADNVDMAAIMEEWKALGVIRLVEIDGKPCGLVKNFSRFQSPKFPTYRYELTEDMIKFVGWKPKKTGKDAGAENSENAECQRRETTPGLPQDYGSAGVVLPPGEERIGEEEEESSLRSLSWRMAAAEPAQAAQQQRMAVRNQYAGWDVADHMALADWDAAEASGEWRSRDARRNALPVAERRADLLDTIQRRSPRAARHIADREVAEQVAV
ncbi:MAG: hypothetical protein PHU07_02205 [Acidocella sp.]|nr:hypothetical protein [Acidocella sp.]